jgi:hypothetical protein
LTFTASLLVASVSVGASESNVQHIAKRIKGKKIMWKKSEGQVGGHHMGKGKWAEMML